jgi:Transmembrane domain of unknown function (DUF3566)
MSTENNAPPAITPRLTVPRPDTSTPPPPPPPPSSAESNGSSGNGTSGHRVSGNRSADDGSAHGGGPSDGMEVASGESRVAVARAGAVKAAAAAIAAAKSAAKKVSASVPAAPPETTHDEIDDRTVKRVTTTAPASVGTGSPTTGTNGSAGSSSMHYSAAGVTGTANPVTGANPATGATPTVRHDGPRRVWLSVSRVDPWSAMKLGFLLAVAIGIMTVVATAVVWYVLDGMMVFQKVQDFVTQIAGEESNVDMLQFVEFGRVISVATLLGVVNVVIITALSTIMAFLYNIVAALVGGVHLTLTDD